MRAPLSYLPPIVIILGALFYGASVYIHAIQAAEQERAREAETAAQFAITHDKIIKTLGQLKNTEGRDIIGGFWFSRRDASGNESVYYADLDALAAEGLTDAQIQALSREVGSSTIIDRANARAVAESDLPPDLQFNNQVYRSSIGGTSTLEIAAGLRRQMRQAPTSDLLFKLSYLAELNGNYAERDALNAENCRTYGVRCDNALKVTLTGAVVDKSGDPVAGASVEIVSRPDARPATTDIRGAYRLTLSVNAFEKLRVRAHKRNFSDGFADALILNTLGRNTYALDPIELQAPITIVTIDYAREAVTGNGNTFNADGSVTLHTPQSTYQIPKGAIVRTDAPYTGSTVDVYLYEFSKGNPPASLMQLDTFDAVNGYAGNLMKTFGMPYIQFFSPEGKELDVLKSNPMVLTYKIANMDELRDNTDQIYRPLTDQDMQTLVNASAGRQYPIDREWLIENGMLQFPAFWVFDKKRGVWDNIGISVLDTSGTIQSLFYTIRDDIN